MISALGPCCHCSPCTGASLGLSQDTSQRGSPAGGPGSVPRREGRAWGRKGQGYFGLPGQQTVWQRAARAQASHTGEARTMERMVPGQLGSSPTAQDSALVALL